MQHKVVVLLLASVLLGGTRRHAAQGFVPATTTTHRSDVVRVRARQFGRGTDGRGDQSRPPSKFPFREGDWHCRNCQQHNFRSRDTCFRCGTKSHVPRRQFARREPFWKKATADFGPAQVVAELQNTVWWLQQRPDLAALGRQDLESLGRCVGAATNDDDDDASRAAIASRFDAFSLDDDNFRHPAFSAKLKDLAPCYPEIYQERENVAPVEQRPKGPARKTTTNKKRAVNATALQLGDDKDRNAPDEEDAAPPAAPKKKQKKKAPATKKPPKARRGPAGAAAKKAD
mmetsp:Transcript_5493/g.17300  ORF Transcript_5493/g.17300 Transcript_5493/m.17300 type:complete len:287 (-) Transcript_5493:1317-2177(-)